MSAGGARAALADLAPERAAPRLRTTLWRLGQRGQDPVEQPAGGLALTARVQVDIHDLSRAAAAIERGECCPGDLGLLGADLLPGWDDDWLVLEQERIHQLRLHSLERLSQAFLDERRYALALDAALLAVHADPLRESAHRAVVRVHLAEGNQAAALKAYGRCRDGLAYELGVRPTRAMDALVAGVAPEGTAGSR